MDVGFSCSRTKKQATGTLDSHPSLSTSRRLRNILACLSPHKWPFLPDLDDHSRLEKGKAVDTQVVIVTPNGPSQACRTSECTNFRAECDGRGLEQIFIAGYTDTLVKPLCRGALISAAGLRAHSTLQVAEVPASQAIAYFLFLFYKHSGARCGLPRLELFLSILSTRFSI